MTIESQDESILQNILYFRQGDSPRLGIYCSREVFFCFSDLSIVP